MEEIKKATCDMDRGKSLGTNDFSPLFLLEFWVIVCHDIFRLLRNSLKANLEINRLNYAHIVLLLFL